MRFKNRQEAAFEINSSREKALVKDQGQNE